MNRAAIYARFSSNNQREESIEAQVRACTDYAQRMGYVVAEIYADRARSGTSDQREQFQRMIKDAQKGGFDRVLVHKLDRFSRDRLDMLLYKRELQQDGVVLESVLERIGDDPESVLLESLLVGVAEFYSKNLAREVKKGLHENALKGLHNGGIVPFGFRLNQSTRKLEEAENEAEGVRLAFDLYLAGCGYTEIADRLNAHGHRTRQGRPFTKASINGMLINEKYAGRLYYGKIAPKDTRKKRNHHKFNENYMVIDGGCPAIVAPEIFEAAQEKLRGRKKGRRCDAKVEWILSGILRCGCCGQLMKVKPRSSRRSDGTVYKSYYYVCDNRDCAMKSVRKEEIEEHVISLLDGCFPDDAVDELAEQLAQAQAPATDYTKQIAAAQLKLDNLSKALADGAPWPAIAAPWQEAEAEKKRLQEAQKKEQAQADGVDPKLMAKMLRQFGVLGSMSEQEQRALIHKNVKSIEVFPAEGCKTFAVKVTVNPTNAPVDRALVGVFGGTGSPVPSKTPKITIAGKAIVIFSFYTKK